MEYYDVLSQQSVILYRYYHFITYKNVLKKNQEQYPGMTWLCQRGSDLHTNTSTE